jgi:hypothetical protein
MKQTILILLLSTTVSLSFTACNQAPKEKASVTGKVIYQCEMDTYVKSDKPGQCPKCGMDLEKKVR